MRTTIQAIIAICIVTPALAQQAPTSAQLPSLDPAIQLGICQQQRARFLSESEQAQTYATQFLAEIADLKKRLAEAEAKIPRER